MPTSSELKSPQCRRGDRRAFFKYSPIHFVHTIGKSRFVMLDPCNYSAVQRAVLRPILEPLVDRMRTRIASNMVEIEWSRATMARLEENFKEISTRPAHRRHNYCPAPTMMLDAPPSYFDPFAQDDLEEMFPRAATVWQELGLHAADELVELGFNELATCIRRATDRFQKPDGAELNSHSYLEAESVQLEAHTYTVCFANKR